VPSPPEVEVVSVTVDRDSHVEVMFSDGKVCRFGLHELRLACPCASCRNARDRGEVAWPPLGPLATELAIVDARLVGAWGLGLTWSDGHSTGIYPFESLRRWCEAGRPAAGFPADSGLPG
jgi:DUF971 family protein